MKARYTARFFIGNKVIKTKKGDNPDELYSWLLIKAQGQAGYTKGNVKDNDSKEVIKSFRKCASD